MAEFFPLASPSDVRAERYNPGFGGATLSGCEIDNNGNVTLDLVNSVLMLIDLTQTGYVPFSTNNVRHAQSISFTENVEVTKVILSLIKLAGSPTGTLTVEIQTDNINKPSGSVVGVASTLNISTILGSRTNYNFAVAASLSANTKYWLVVRCGGGTVDSSNHIGVYRDTSNPYLNGLHSQSNDNGSTWTDYPTEDLQLNIEYNYSSVSGTVTEDITVSSLAEWYKYYRKTTEPTNTSVSCAIKDTEDNVLIASVDDGDSLSAIDATIYKTIRVVHTLTRNSISDDTPKLHYREVSWIGPERVVSTFPIVHQTSSTSLVTAFEKVNGNGELSVVTVYADYGNYLRMTIDGVVIIDTPVGFDFFMPAGGINLILNAPYKSGFKIEHCAGADNKHSNVIIAYKEE